MSAAAPAQKLPRIGELHPRVRLLRRAWTIDARAARLWLCAAPGLAFFLLWSARDGGYDATSWLLGGVALVTLAAWARLVFGPTRALGRRGRLALAALALYVAWSYASVLWAVDKGAALTGSHRALLYLLVFGLFAGLEWNTQAARACAARLPARRRSAGNERCWPSLPLVPLGSCSREASSRPVLATTTDRRAGNDRRAWLDPARLLADAQAGHPRGCWWLAPRPVLRSRSWPRAVAGSTRCR